MAELEAYKSNDGSLWVFPNGPNHAGAYIGCVEADDISAPQGDTELIRCFDVYGRYKTVGKIQSPPDPVTTTLTSLTYRTRNLLEKIRCEYGLMFLQRDGGRADLFCNHQRALILDGVVNTEKTYIGILKRSEEVSSERGFAIAANPPPIDVAEVKGNRKSTTETADFMDVFMIRGDCDPCLEGVAVANGIDYMGANANVYLTHDGGQSWTATTNPANVVDATACVLLDMCNGIRRILVGGLAVNGVQGYTAYSDDDGVTWTLATVGAPAGGDGVTHGGGIFTLGANYNWLASADGYIYFSGDGGETWAAQELATITGGDYTQVEFTAEGLHGYAVAAGGIIAKTTNGGASWTAATPEGGNLLTVVVKDDDYAWIGDDVGGIYWTEDGGTTWEHRTGWVGSGTAVDINDIAFANDWVGFMIAGIKGSLGKVYRTIDGGYTWDILTSDTNEGLNALVACDENYAVYVGDVVAAGTGFAGVVEE